MSSSSVFHPLPGFLVLAVALALPAAALAPAAASAQLPARDPLVGSRVRIHTAALEDVPVTGTVETVRDGRLVVRLGRGRERVELPAAALSRLEVAHPRPTLRRNLIVGGALGAAAGAGAYLSLCYADRAICPRVGDPGRHGARSPTAALLSSAAGMLVGGGIAYALTPQRWQHVPFPVSVGVSPGAGGIVVGARIGNGSE